MKNDTHYKGSLVSTTAAGSISDAPHGDNPSKAVLTLGAARLRMANERTGSCLGPADADSPLEMPAAIIAILALACSVAVLLIGIGMKLFGL